MTDVKPLAEMTRILSAVAMGREAADLVIRNGKLVNVNTLEIQENVDVAVKGGRIALVGDAGRCIGEGTKVLDARGMYLTPGFMDGHMHVESSMLTVSQYSQSVVPRGTSAIFMDPHEIANVLGMRGVELMADEAREVPLRVYTTMPSCVPAAPGFEDAGAAITPDQVASVMGRDDMVGLGEMMNFPGIVNGDPEVHEMVAATLAAGKCVTGHFSIPETGPMLSAYAAAGIRSCHESVRAEDALAKMRLGMYAKIREGSAWHDLKEVIKAITEKKASGRFALLVSDDLHPDTLVNKGHLDHIVKRAVEEGVNPVEAISMVTLNVAECFNMTRDFGSIAPGKTADINLIGDLSRVTVEKVIIGGVLVAENGGMIEDTGFRAYPEWSKNTVNLGRKPVPADFRVTAEGEMARVHVMAVSDSLTGTTHLREALPVEEGEVTFDPQGDIAKVAVFERHKGTGSFGLGFVRGFGLKRGAVASTVAHDCHNLLVVGTNDVDMAFAGNALAEAGGGMIAVADGKVLALVPLPVAGLMSDRPLAEVLEQVTALEGAWEDLGCGLNSPFMTMALLALPVLPELRITNRGLVDTVNFKLLGGAVESAGDS